MKQQTYKVTDNVVMTNCHYYIIKINNEDYGIVPTSDKALAIIKDQMEVLMKELSEDPLVKSGWTTLLLDVSENTTTIYKQALGRVVNGTKVPVYKMTFAPVAECLLKSSLRPKPEKITIVELPKPQKAIIIPDPGQYAEFHIHNDPVMKTAQREIHTSSNKSIVEVADKIVAALKF